MDCSKLQTHRRLTQLLNWQAWAVVPATEFVWGQELSPDLGMHVEVILGFEGVHTLQKKSFYFWSMVTGLMSYSGIL